MADLISPDTGSSPPLLSLDYARAAQATLSPGIIITMAITSIVVILVFGAVTWALEYHWRRYRIEPKKTLPLRMGYYGVSFILLGSMIFSLLGVVI
jgi:hypothetical protein